MKKLFLSIIICMITVIVGAQNVQLHYDFGSMIYDSQSTRPKVTTTVEMFKPDSWGSTFFFVDMDYTNKGVTGAYWEIARELKFWNGPFSAHVEYNGGLNSSSVFNNSYLLGATYSWNSSDFSKGFTFTPTYKIIQKNVKPHNFQLTITWYVNFCKDKLTFSGFADFWKEKHGVITGFGNDGNAVFENRNFIFITEPQFWVNLNKFDGVSDKFNLSVGSEWEISSNFGIMNGWKWMPTLAMKWSF